MSQNKTIVPGVDYDNPGSSEYDEAAFSSLYTRSGNDDNRTCKARQAQPWPTETPGR